MCIRDRDTAVKAFFNNAPELYQAAYFMLNRCTQFLVMAG
jgi:hypothetical protein